MNLTLAGLILSVGLNCFFVYVLFFYRVRLHEDDRQRLIDDLEDGVYDRRPAGALDIYMEREWSIGFKRESPIAHGRHWFEWTLSLGPFRVSRLSGDAKDIIADKSGKARSA